MIDWPLGETDWVHIQSWFKRGARRDAPFGINQPEVGVPSSVRDSTTLRPLSYGANSVLTSKSRPPEPDALREIRRLI